eukprot:3538705-Pleurochrysis_carterae.AAC.1
MCGKGNRCANPKRGNVRQEKLDEKGGYAEAQTGDASEKARSSWRDQSVARRPMTRLKVEKKGKGGHRER